MFSGLLRSRILLVPRRSQGSRIHPFSTSSPTCSGHNKVRLLNTTGTGNLLKLGTTCVGDATVVENPAKEGDQ